MMKSIQSILKWYSRNLFQCSFLKMFMFNWQLLYKDCIYHFQGKPGYFANKYRQIISCGVLTHWGRMTHLDVGKLTIIVLDDGLSPFMIFSLKKIRLKISSVKCWPFRLGLNVLTCRCVNLSHPQPPLDRNHQHKHVNLILVLLLLAAIFSHSQNSLGLKSISQIIPRNAGTLGTQDTTPLPFLKHELFTSCCNYLVPLFYIKIIINRVHNISKSKYCTTNKLGTTLWTSHLPLSLMTLLHYSQITCFSNRLFHKSNWNSSIHATIF